MMGDVFEKLRTLQDILSKKFEIEGEIRDIPKNLATKTEMLNRLKKSYIERNEKFEKLKGQINSLKIQMSDAETQREKYEKQMDLIKTQREYEALDKEIKDANDKEQNLRREIQGKTKIMDEMAHAIERDEQMIKQQEEELEKEQENITLESAEKEKVLTSLEIDEAEILPDLDSEIVFKFERIIRNKEGVGIVPIHQQVCTGCHMILPNQFVNEVRAGREILFCPYCSRILYFEEVVNEEEVAFIEADSGGLSDLVDSDAEL